MKRKSKLFNTMTVMTVLTAISIAPVFADTVDNQDNQKSEAKVEFMKDSTGPVGPVDPVDPTDPSNPGTGGTGSEGDFTIDYVPELDFGKIKIKGNDTKVYKKTINQKPYVQVSDRRLTGEGWALQAKISDFVHTNNKNKISGAKIKFQDGAVQKVNSESTPPTLVNPITIDGKSKTVMSASENSGLGTWLATWINTNSQAEENEKVELEIPVTDAIMGNYNAEITWTLIRQP